MTCLSELFTAITHLDSYQRVDAVHLLDLYVGIDEMSRWTLLLLSDIQPPSTISSKMIISRVGVRPDGRWALTLSLTNESYKDIFLLFCEDIVESSRGISDKMKAVRFVVQRYKEWREMLANSTRNTLSSSEIKGLLGEMYFLKEYLSDRYGIERAVESWTGPKQLPQDFIIENTWYEIKTISSNKSEVSISSVEQLDSNCVGELVIIKADKTSVTSADAINLNLLYRSLLESIKNDDVKTKFSNMLLRYGYYPRREYEEEDYTFAVRGRTHYIVDSTFPCLRRIDLPDSITKAEYCISIPTISAYRKE